MNATETMATYEAKTAKKVFLYKNGSLHARPKCMVVNDRQIRDFSTFLSRVTSGIRAPVAVRNIYTPSEGHRVQKLADLQSGHYYVAGGSENFKKIKYGREVLKSPTKKPKHEFFLPNRSQPLTVTTTPRYNLPLEKPFVIHVFRNGDEKYRGARVLLPRKIMGSWERVLELVTEKTNLFTPAKRICTLDSRVIHSVSEIQDGGKYVAMEGSKSFQRVAYCATGTEKKALIRSFPRAAVRLRRRIEHQSRSETDGGMSDTTSKQPHPPRSPPPPGLIRRKKSIRPMAGRKNKEGREKAIMDHREDSIFGGSPIHERGLDESLRITRMPSPPLKSVLMTIRQGGTESDKEDNLESLLEEPPVRESSPVHVQETAEASKPPSARERSGGAREESVRDRSGGAREGSVRERSAGAREESVRERSGGARERSGGTRERSGGARERSAGARERSSGVRRQESAREEGEGVSQQQGSASFKREMFHAARSSSKHMQTSVEYVEESQDNVFKAHVEHNETEEAETILEGGETEVEKPVDEEEAEEVVEEEEEEEHDGQQRDEPPARISKDIELESQPTQTTIDLSVNRNSSKTNSQHNSTEHTASLPPPGSKLAIAEAEEGQGVGSGGGVESSSRPHTSSRPTSHSRSAAHSQHSLHTAEHSQEPERPQEVLEEPQEVEEQQEVEEPQEVAEEPEAARTQEEEVEEIKEEVVEEVPEENTEVPPTATPPPKSSTPPPKSSTPPHEDIPTADTPADTQQQPED